MFLDLKDKALFLCDSYFSARYPYNLMVSYQHILEHDPDFFRQVCIGLGRNLCDIRRLDRCANHSEDTIDLVNENVKQCTMHGFNSQYGTAPGLSFSNIVLGALVNEKTCLRALHVLKSVSMTKLSPLPGEHLSPIT